MPAGIAHVDVATERSGPATRDGLEDSSFLGGKSVRACERLTVSTDDGRDLDGRSVDATLAVTAQKHKPRRGPHLGSRLLGIVDSKIVGTYGTSLRNDQSCLLRRARVAWRVSGQQRDHDWRGGRRLERRDEDYRNPPRPRRCLDAHLGGRLRGAPKVRCSSLLGSSCDLRRRWNWR